MNEVRHLAKQKERNELLRNSMQFDVPLQKFNNSLNSISNSIQQKSFDASPFTQYSIKRSRESEENTSKSIKKVKLCSILRLNQAFHSSDSKEEPDQIHEDSSNPILQSPP
eukprot:TRINITY_DN454_c0_g1_i1.p3 TRINITY_DN454_c0_g1~~TRINITY_DN454_c0_g1_i1.p3  ORF type:complete len:111 (+),score=47.83 TRINITY_DN454_c0_g1_i1:1181-1513(+)